MEKYLQDPPEDPQLTELARRLAEADLSAESRVRQQLRQRLAQKVLQQQRRAAPWAVVPRLGAVVILAVVIGASIGNIAFRPGATALATALAAPVAAEFTSTAAITPSSPLPPRPAPTPLAPGSPSGQGITLQPPDPSKIR